MNGNYFFQKQQANEQIQARYQEAENHRLSRQGNGRTPLSLLLKLTLPLLAAVAAAVLLLAGCTTGEFEPEKSAEEAAAVTEVTLADRIHFQDARDTKYEVNLDNPPIDEVSQADRIHFQDARDTKYEVNLDNPLVDEVSQADRIHFHDKLDGHLMEEQGMDASSGWTMADRIQFHDRIWEQRP